MKYTQSRLCREALSAVLEFHARGLWREWENEECFAVVVPGEEYPMYASVMGQGGEEFGLMLFRGEDAARNLVEMLNGDPRDLDMPDEVAFMGFSMSLFSEVPPFARSFLKKAQVPCRRDSLVPFLVVQEPGKCLRGVLPDEVLKLLFVLKGVLKAHEEGLLKPDSILCAETVQTLVVDGDPLAPQATVESRPNDGMRSSNIVKLPNVPNDLRGLPRLAGRWIIGYERLPVAIDADDRTVRMIVVADEKTEMILAAEAIRGGISEAVETVYDVFRGDNSTKTAGIPDEILVAHRGLFNALAPTLKALGVPNRYEPGMPLLEEILDELLERLDEGGSPDDDPKPPEITSMPAPGDLDGWKALSLQMDRRAGQRIFEMIGRSDRAMVRYFGDRDSADHFLRDYGTPFPLNCFADWCLLYYRAGKRSETLAESMLKESIPEPEIALLKAKMQARTSVYRIDRICGEGELTCVDVLFGGETVVHDRGLSKTAAEGLCLAAYLYRAGDFYFASPLGPALIASEAADAIEYLQDLGLELTPEGMARHAYLFGRLWNWVKERRENSAPPVLRNSDGEDLCFHTATYKVHDEGAVRAALAERKDIRQEGDDQYSWVGNGGKSSVFANGLHLASLEFVADALLVKVNSAERLQRVRKWLDGVPGLCFQCVRVRTVETMMEEGIPPDDRRGPEDRVPMTPELAAAVRSMMHSHYMRWLDTPIRALDGKTPRQACASAKGREKVALMIRAIPRPDGPGNVDMDVPREEMLKELGLT
ncbi:MAG TPA: hypothetical protein P5137_12005 [Candidatus Brocadiia bacterium]|nr:hypothetical protein [Candidatus Brocadiia bacterium]